MVVFRHVKAAYGKETLFENLNFHIPEKETAVLTGPSGSGKTSILHLVLGFTRPASGFIRVGGYEVNAANIHKVRSITGYVAQHPQAAEGTVHDYILKPFRFKRNQNIEPDMTAIEENFTAVGLEKSLIKKKTKELSGGQLQRVALVIAHMLEPKLLVLDEPTSALDPQSKQKVIDYIFSMGATVLSVSHDPDWISKCHLRINPKETGAA